MRILFFGHLKDITRCGEMDLSADGADAEAIWARLLQQHPGLAACRASVRLAKNWEYVSADARFEEGDEVALIPPVSGG